MPLDDNFILRSRHVSLDKPPETLAKLGVRLIAERALKLAQGETLPAGGGCIERGSRFELREQKEWIELRFSRAGEGFLGKQIDVGEIYSRSLADALLACLDAECEAAVLREEEALEEFGRAEKVKVLEEDPLAKALVEAATRLLPTCDVEERFEPSAHEADFALGYGLRVVDGEIVAPNPAPPQRFFALRGSAVLAALPQADRDAFSAIHSDPLAKAFMEATTRLLPAWDPEHEGDAGQVEDAAQKVILAMDCGFRVVNGEIVAPEPSSANSAPVPSQPEVSQ